MGWRALVSTLITTYHNVIHNPERRSATGATCARASRSLRAGAKGSGTVPGSPTVRDMAEAHFSIGQIVRHQRFEYRGVIVDADASFQGSDAWYEQVARSRPPRDAPWYHVLVHGAEHSTYVAERHLADDESGDPVAHPWLEGFFDTFEDGRYSKAGSLN